MPSTCTSVAGGCPGARARRDTALTGAADSGAISAGRITTDHRADSGAWLISPTSDFWLASAGGGVLLLAIALVLQWRGDRELCTADLLLAELHLGATYDAVFRRRLWQRMPLEIIAAPIAITAATYYLMLTDRAALVTTVVLYLAAWHRGRQNFGIARWYQVHMGGPVSASHRRLFRAAIYLPMLTGAAYFASTAPLYEGDEFLALALDPAIVQALAVVAVVGVGAYLVFAARHRARIHPGEWWLVVANALAFGSGYVLGAWTMSFMLVLALHHEVQYLWFTYAMARRSSSAGELRLLASFALWPALGLSSWALCRLSDSDWVPPFLVGGLLCHYWLDGRIWTARARRLAI
jgi:hypothetical protein